MTPDQYNTQRRKYAEIALPGMIACITQMPRLEQQALVTRLGVGSLEEVIAKMSFAQADAMLKEEGNPLPQDAEIKRLRERLEALEYIAKRTS